MSAGRFRKRPNEVQAVLHDGDIEATFEKVRDLGWMRLAGFVGLSGVTPVSRNRCQVFLTIGMGKPNGDTYHRLVRRDSANRQNPVWENVCVESPTKGHTMVDIELEKAGCYKVLTPSPDGCEWAIVRMDDMREGPAGGLYPMWEPVRFEPGQGWIAGECWPARTLRQARKDLAVFLGVECVRCHGTGVNMGNVFEDCPACG